MSPMRHPVLAIEIDDVARSSVGIAHWISNSAGEAIATRARELDHPDDLDALLAEAGSTDDMDARQMRAFLAYRRGLERYRGKLPCRRIWLD